MNKNILMLALLLVSCGNSSGNSVETRKNRTVNVANIVDNIAKQIESKIGIVLSDELKKTIKSKYSSTEKIDDDRVNIVNIIIGTKISISTLFEMSMKNNQIKWNDLDKDKQNRMLSYILSFQLKLMFETLTLEDMKILESHRKKKANLKDINLKTNLVKKFMSENKELSDKRVKIGSKVSNHMLSKECKEEMNKIINI